jgi:replicative DNA helicase
MSTGEKVLAALQAYDVKRERDGEYRANSPLRPGSNSHAFKVKISTDGEFGAYHDHVSHDKGSLYDLAAALGIETPRQEVAETKRAYASLDEYAAVHGLTADEMRAAGWQDARMVHDYKAQRDRLALQFKTATGIRYRFIDGDSKEAKYKSENGYKACWYGLKKAVQLAREKQTPLILCNGEVSTIAAHKHGVPAACVTGGEKALTPEQLDELRAEWQGKVWIALDCDKTGRDTAWEIHGQLGANVATVIDLGFSKGGDLADFCMLHEKGALTELSKRAVDLPMDAPKEDAPDPLAALSVSANQLSLAIKQDAKAKERLNIEAIAAKMQADLDRVLMNTASAKLETFSTVAERAREAFREACKNPNPIRGLMSRIQTIDEMIGGFREAWEIVIYGATNMGKSSLATTFAAALIKQEPGLFLTTESIPDRWMNKLVGAMCRINSGRIANGNLTPPEMKVVDDTFGYLMHDSQCAFLNAPRPTPQQLRAAVLEQLDKGHVGFVMIDSVSNMTSPGASGIYDTTKAVNDGVQSLMLETKLPFILTSQVGRDVSERPQGKKMPTLVDGYGGGVIENNADVVLGLYNHQYYVDLGLEQPDERMPQGTALVRLLKHRWGEGSRTHQAVLKFEGGVGFSEYRTVHVNDVIEDAFNGK